MSLCDLKEKNDLQYKITGLVVLICIENHELDTISKSLELLISRLFDINHCDSEGIRTPNQQSRNLLFYPVELRRHFFGLQI